MYLTHIVQYPDSVPRYPYVHFPQLIVDPSETRGVLILSFHRAANGLFQHNFIGVLANLYCYITLSDAPAFIFLVITEGFLSQAEGFSRL